MSIYLKDYINKNITNAYKEYDLKGGALRFNLWQLNRSKSNKTELNSYNVHKVVARQTIDKIHYETTKRWNSVVTEYNRSEYPELKVDYDKLDNSGIKLSPKEFLGYAYDWQIQKPIVKGKSLNTNWFFRYDQAEIESNKIEIDYSVPRLEKLGLEFNGGFIQAFLYPPFSLKLDGSIKQTGEYVIDFMKLFFDDLQNIEIFTWSIDCAFYFDAGKEWWGSYFWTVFNPTKDIYLGIVASETD